MDDGIVTRWTAATIFFVGSFCLWQSHAGAQTALSPLLSAGHQDFGSDRFPLMLTAFQQTEEAPPLVDRAEVSAALANQPAADGGGSNVEQYGEAPVDRTPQFLRRVTPLLRPGQWQFDYGLVYVLQEINFPTLAGPGPVLASADLRRRAWFTPLAFRYGWNERTQLFVNIPLGWSDTELADPFADQSRSEGGVGDVSFGVTRLLHQNRCTGKSTIFTFRAAAPTGTAVNPLLLTSAGLGNGVWRLGGDLLHVQPLDPMILFYGIGYTYSFEEEFSGVDIQLGHQISYTFGIGFAASERVTLSTTFLGSYVTESEYDGLNVPNSDLEPMRIRLAATIAQRCRLVEPFVTFGITDTAPSAEVGVTWTR